MLRILIVIAMLVSGLTAARAQTLNAGTFQIEWQVVNRFRLFRDLALFKRHENAWRQYVLHVEGRGLAAHETSAHINRTSVLGSEHVLNDRHIAFTRLLRQNFDWRGWAAEALGGLCYDSETRRHSACGGIDAWLNPPGHGIELWLTALGREPLPADKSCEWRIGGQVIATAPCGERVSGPRVALPYPAGAEISVAVVGEQPIALAAKVRDIVIVGLGDSFASGEGNPDVPVEFAEARRHRNLYPRRKVDGAAGSAQWTDRLCHRSPYGHQFRAALQIGIENPQAAVTFLDYSCSGAGVEEGILGPQQYVERQSMTGMTSQPAAIPLSGGNKDSQIYRLLRDVCLEKPKEKKGLWTCPDDSYRRNIDFVFLSVGGNDIGFANVVAWATLREGASATIAKFFGATVSAKQFAENMREVLPGAYARLAKAFETALPVYSAGDKVFDASRVVLTAYPDPVTDETGNICKAGGDDEEDLYPVNQALDGFSSWLVASNSRLSAVHESLGTLHKTMRDLAGDHGWSFAGRIYGERMFEGHGFCARNPKFAFDPPEVLMIPCWGDATRPTLTCQSSWTGKVKQWRPYDPAAQNYPYALRQRWVRSFNDAYMTINQKVVDRRGTIDERTSAGVFSETTGALHPTAEGHAAMADALLIEIRPALSGRLSGQ
jgi:lysophospholipase L1-like esterase